MVPLFPSTVIKSGLPPNVATLPLRQYKGVTFDGRVVYEDQEVSIPSTAIDGPFIENLSQLIKRVVSTTPARKVPSQMECGFCNLTAADALNGRRVTRCRKGKPTTFRQWSPSANAGRKCEKRGGYS